MELSIATIIKFIIGILVIGAVVYGLYLVFKSQVSDPFGNIGMDGTIKSFLALI